MSIWYLYLLWWTLNWITYSGPVDVFSMNRHDCDVLVCSWLLHLKSYSYCNVYIRTHILSIVLGITKWHQQICNDVDGLMVDTRCWCLSFSFVLPDVSPGLSSVRQSGGRLSLALSLIRSACWARSTEPCVINCHLSGSCCGLSSADLLEYPRLIMGTGDLCS